MFSEDILAVKNSELWTIYIPETEYNRLNELGKEIFLQGSNVNQYIQECLTVMDCYNNFCNRITSLSKEDKKYCENIVITYFRLYSALMAQYRITNLECTALLEGTVYVERLMKIRWQMRQCFMNGNKVFYNFLKQVLDIAAFDQLISYMTPEDILRCVSSTNEFEICNIHEVWCNKNELKLLSYSDDTHICTYPIITKNLCVKGHNVSSHVCIREKVVVLKNGNISDADRCLLKDQKCILITIAIHFDLNEFRKNIVGLVCDEGGVMSHAAILAREYNLPCITDTKIATLVFKTGDYVELNTSTESLRLCHAKLEGSE